MSAYEVSRFCRDVLMDETFRKLVENDPGSASELYDLTEEERDLLLHGEVGRLARLGANGYLLSHLPRFGLLGLDAALYSERMRAAAP